HYRGGGAGVRRTRRRRHAGRGGGAGVDPRPARPLQVPVVGADRRRATEGPDRQGAPPGAPVARRARGRRACRAAAPRGRRATAGAPPTAGVPATAAGRRSRGLGVPLADTTGVPAAMRRLPATRRRGSVVPPAAPRSRPRQSRTTDQTAPAKITT